MPSEAAVRCDHLVKTFDTTRAVDDLSVGVGTGQIFGLLGPNGAGKTTTILMLLGLTEPASGSAQVFGFNSTREPLKVKRLTGYLPERLGFYDGLTARQNLRFIAWLNNMSDDEANTQIDQVLGAVGLTEVADTAVGKFSRGMKQRLGVADVLVKKPKLAILDEPTAGLDPKGINQILDLIAGLTKMGTTVIMCSHRLYEVQRICQSIAILAGGKLVVEGTLDALGREALAEGRYRIEVETDGASPQLVEVIGKIKGVRNVEAEGNFLHITTDSDLRAAISKVVVDSGAALIQMKVREFSLDDIYKKYFKEG